MLNGLSSVTSIKSILSPIINDAWNINLSSRSISYEYVLLLFLAEKLRKMGLSAQSANNTTAALLLSSRPKLWWIVLKAATGKLCLDRTLSDWGGGGRRRGALEQLPTWKYSWGYYPNWAKKWTYRYLDLPIQKLPEWLPDSWSLLKKLQMVRGPLFYGIEYSR